MANLIVKDNALIEASHKLSEIEQRLILLAILKARETGNSVEELKDKELIIHADDYIKNFGATRQGAYKALKQAVMGLYRAEWGYKYITEKGEKRVKYERFTQSADYGENSGIVKFMFSTAIIPLLVELEKRFTVYDIAQVAQLSSSYAMRLYEFFMQHFDKRSGKGWLEISLEDLRFRFGLLPTEYDRLDNFKKRVLDNSIKQINKETDLTATYTQRKNGRMIVGFRFEFERKKQPKPKSRTKPDKPEPDCFDGLADLERSTIQTRIHAHIARLEAKGEIVDDFHRQNITNKAVLERWGLDIFDKKSKKKQKDDKQKQIEQLWGKVPNGTRFRHKQDGSLWFKEAGFLRNSENRVVPDGQIVNIFQELEQID